MEEYDTKFIDRATPREQRRELWINSRVVVAYRARKPKRHRHAATVPGPFVSISLFQAATSKNVPRAFHLDPAGVAERRKSASFYSLDLLESSLPCTACCRSLLSYFPSPRGHQPPPFPYDVPFVPEGNTKLPRGKGNTKKMTRTGWIDCDACTFLFPRSALLR